MPDLSKLQALSIDELRAELDARKAQIETRLAVPRAAALDEFDNAAIVGVLREKQKVIYGVDDRIDVLVGDANLDADCVVALFRANNVVDNGNGTSTLTTQNFGTARGLCQGEPFRNQPIGAFCSGFLVAADVIATAGHCVNANNVTNVRFVFGFRMQNATTAQVVINNAEIYRGVHVIGRQEVGNGPDWALVQIDRPVTNHRIAPFRRNGRIPDGQAVHVIGHPSGLPLKLAGGAAVRNNQPAAFFVANLDTYGGNSGSPVFNAATREVEGILVRGENDFVRQGNCSVSLVCPTTGCRGEDCTRVTEFTSLLPDNVIYAIQSDGKLLWYQHLGQNDGSFNWQGPNEVDTGWQFTKVFSGGAGVVYAIQSDGKLLWYRHLGQNDGSFNWQGPNEVGMGWQQFTHVFSGGAGVLYAVQSDGKLLWYRHLGQGDGSFNWEGPREVGTGWQQFSHIFSGGGGVIYAIQSDGKLLWYRHLGQNDGSFNWQGPNEVGTGWALDVVN